MCAHVDDNDGTFEKAADAKWWTEATNELFKSDKSPGIKVVNADYMLGVTRELTNKDGIRYCNLSIWFGERLLGA